MYKLDSVEAIAKEPRYVVPNEDVLQMVADLRRYRNLKQNLSNVRSQWSDEYIKDGTAIREVWDILEKFDAHSV